MLSENLGFTSSANGMMNALNIKRLDIAVESFNESIQKAY